MKRFVEGVDRGQSTLLPECLDDWIDENNPVRVIDAFVGIASKGSGNIGAVAPGVAEALIATAAALSVAIPAVFAYNIFAARLNKVEGQLESIGSEFIALMVREGMI